MNVLHVTPWFPPAWRYGGVVTSVDALSRAQARAGHSVTVLTTDADGPDRVASPPLDVRNDVRVRTFRHTFPRRLYHAPGLRVALADELANADVCHVHGLFHQPALDAVRESLRAEVTTIVSSRGMLVAELIAEKSPWIKRLWLSRFPAKRVDGWLATSARERTDLVRMQLEPERIHVIPNGVEPDPRSEVEVPAEVGRLLEGPPFALYLGRLSWKKGIDVLMQAWRPHAERVRLVLAGADDEGLADGLRAEHGELLATGRLVLLGSLERAIAERLFANARLLALFSRHENFGNVVFEAALAGVPVVAHDTVGAAEWIREADAGWVGRPGEAAELLARALDDPKEAAARGERGRVMAREWSWDRVAERTGEAYRSVRATMR